MHEILECLIELVVGLIDLGEVWRFGLCLCGSIAGAFLIGSWAPARNLPVWPIFLLVGCTLGIVWEVASRP